ncbi:MAG: DUF2341 domain-containing protein, partial [Candidatus Paceibacterota bacterium]
MEVSNFSQQIKNGRWIRYGAAVFIIIFLVLIFFWVKSWFAPREPKVPLDWSQEIVGYWAFEEPKDQIIKDTAKQNDGQLGDNAGVDQHDPKRTSGKLASGLKFEGEDYALVPYDKSFDLEEEITLEAWVKPQASSANEDLWLSGWKYRKRIILTNEKKDSFKNAQVKVILNTKKLIEEEKLQPDCRDLRFTKSNKTTKINWFIEEGCNSTTTEIWVKVPSLEAHSQKPIYAYYGNFEVGSQSGFQQAMESPPVKSWKWPERRHLLEEKPFAVDINSADQALVGGYQNRRIHEGQKWKTVQMHPDGFASVRSYELSTGANQINDVKFISEDDSLLVGFDTKQGDSRWRIRKRGGKDVEWKHTINPSNGSDQATALDVAENGDLIVGGYDNSKGNAQWRVERLTGEGEEIWTYTFNPSSGADTINDLTIDSEGNILVAGVDKKKGHDQWRLVKLSSEGDLLFSYLLDVSNKSDVLTSVEVDSKDNILLGGFDFKPGNFQWRLVKLNSDGERLWSYNKNFSGGSDQIKAMAIDVYDNIIIGGYDYEPGEAQWRAEKLNPEGERLWSYVENPSSGFDAINGLDIDSEDNIVLAGVTNKHQPEFLIEKISEKKYYNLKPEVEVLEEETFKEIPSLAVGKLDSYGLRVNENKVTGSINNNLISTDLSPGWSHLVLTYDGSQQNLYVNSELKTSQALSGNIDTNYNNLLLGFNYAGHLDEVKVYNKALTSDEVQRIYQNF